MVSLNGILNMGASALDAEQTASEVTGQNISNVNTPGYARETVNLDASTPLATLVGDEGTGVTVASITGNRDAFLDSQITAETSVTGSLTAQQTALQNAQTELGAELDGSTSAASGSGSATALTQTGLAADLSNLFNSFQTLSSDPGSVPQRQVVVQESQTATEDFNSVSSGLQTVNAQLNQSVQNGVNGANQDLAQIASLNKQIVLAEAGGKGPANDLINERQQTLQDLAGKVNITTATESDGAVDVSIGGVTMVSGLTTPDSLQTYDSGNGQLLVQAQNAGTPLTLTSGSIQGAIDVRDGALATLQNNVNTLAGQLITQVNSIYSAGYDLNGNTGQSFFTGTNASDIGVNANVVSDPSQFQAGGTANSGDNSVALSLAQLGTTKVAALGNQTFSQNYAQTVAGMGQSLNSVNSQLTTQNSVASMLQNEQSSETGVSLDEEMTNLLQYQQAYEASAKLVTSIDQMMEEVVQLNG